MKSPTYIVTKRGNLWTFKKIRVKDPITADFKYSDVQFKKVAQHRNPSYSEAMFSHMNVMADIVATMSEHTTWDGIEQRAASTADLLLTNSEKFSNLSPFDKFSYYFSIYFSSFSLY